MGVKPGSGREAGGLGKEQSQRWELTNTDCKAGTLASVSHTTVSPEAGVVH